jgi:hypothetical protein
MKVLTLLKIFLFISFSVKSQHYFDFALQKVDRIDGKIDGVITTFDTINHQAIRAFLHLPDSIRHTTNSSSLSKEIKENIILKVYEDLMLVNAKDFLFPEKFAKKYLHLLKWIEYEQKETSLRFLNKNSDKSFALVRYIYPGSSTEKFLKSQIYLNSEKVISTFSDYHQSDYAIELAEAATIANPIVAKRYFSSKHELFKVLQFSENPIIQTILEINRVKGRNTKAYLLAVEISENSININEAHKISTDEPEKLLTELLKIRAKNNEISVAAIDKELENLSLRFVRRINDLYEETSSVKRFKSVQKYSSSELYTLLVYSEEEIFTSTFNGIYDLLIQAIKKEKIDGKMLLENLGYNRFRTFLKMCAGFGKLNHFLEQFSKKEEQEAVIRKFISEIPLARNPVEESVSVADAMGSISNIRLLKIIEQQLILSYLEQGENTEEQLLYGLLIHVFSPKSTEQKSTLDSISNLYPIPYISSLSIGSLLGKDSVNIQIHFFYDDEDGHTSFNTFLYHFKQPGWVIVDYPQYVLIASIKGNRIQIYANKPQFERTAPQIIADSLNTKKLQPQIVVHRGHSFYIHHTMEAIHHETQLILLGSCGSYHRLSDALDKAPYTHIISTKQIGSMHVNNPMIFAFSEKIRKGEDLEWESFWKEMKKKLSENSYAHQKFKEYIGPHQNLGARFIQAYKMHL